MAKLAARDRLQMSVDASAMGGDANRKKKQLRTRTGGWRMVDGWWMDGNCRLSGRAMLLGSMLLK